MNTYTCKRCGKTFESGRKSAFCEDCKVGHCIICGKEFSRTSDYPGRECCSRTCAGKHRAETGAGKEIAKKIQATRLERYGSLRSDIFKVYTKICKFCGKEFVTKSPRQVYCEGPHYGTCPICRGPSLITDLSTGVVPTCSEKCRQEQIIRTNRERYGVSNVFQSEEVKEKSKETLNSKYGVDHYSKTDEYKQHMSEILPEAYQRSSEQRKQTNIDRYGVPYPMMNDDIKKKSRETFEREHGGVGWASPEIGAQIAATNIERYGFANPMQNSEVQARSQQGRIDKYGPDPYHHPAILAARKQTSLERYGTEHPSQSKQVKDKMRHTFQELLGVDNPFQSKAIQQQIAETNLDRYGVVNPMQNKSIQQKAEATNLLKYGRAHFRGSDADLQNSSYDVSKLEIYKQFRDNTEEFLKSYASPPTLRILAEDTGTNQVVVSYIVIRNNCQHLVSYVHTPYMEQDILDFLSEYVDASDIKKHDRVVIGPKEIDIYLPKYHLGIECNPTYTHNSSKSAHFSDFVVPDNYHQQKTLDAEKEGIRLIHIFGYQWNRRPEVIKSMLVNILGKTPVVYYARDLVVQEVSDTDSRKFLEENHIQGYTTSKVRLGLYDGSELVSLMTFSHKRSTLGHKDTDTESDWDLTRFCNKIYTRCTGGASKLFKYFVEHYHPDSVVSFSDRSTTSGNLYNALGFKFDSYTGIGYVWVDSKTDAYYTRVSCQKKRLRKLFNDPTIDIDHKTEAEIMEEHGFVRVCNSGLIKWMWNK